MAAGALRLVQGTETHAPRVLLVDDEPRLLNTLRRLIEPEGFKVFEATDGASALRELHREPDVALLDLQLGETSGIQLIPEIHRSCPDTEIIVITGYATIDSAVQCMRAGAFDYLEKPFHDTHRVVQTLHRALERRALRVRNRQLEGELDRRSVLESIVVHSASMRRVVQTVMDLSANESNVLIEAESGTGKELIARAIHQTSPRKAGPFVPVDCGALPQGLVEAELFGYRAGAFTGAVRESQGLFRRANGGTLFLDEIGELPLLMQSKLLRALQEREVRPLGAPDAVPVDVRIIAATNRHLDEEQREGRFRRDLYYRLRVVSIHLPPLRERPEDITPLAMEFLNRLSGSSKIEGIEPEAIEALLSQPWEGNVRELENRIEAAVALARGPRLTSTDLELERTVEPRSVSSLDTVPLSLAAYERRCLEDALSAAAGDVRLAASLLGIGRSTFYRKMGR